MTNVFELAHNYAQHYYFLFLDRNCLLFAKVTFLHGSIRAYRVKAKREIREINRQNEFTARSVGNVLG